MVEYFNQIKELLKQILKIFQKNTNFQIQTFIERFIHFYEFPFSEWEIAVLFNLRSRDTSASGTK